ncbi:hypothetical protein IH979_02365 [Patescibacteria group bacterium]|nr:hypothetical protein [Patescibacteria group bacterium]
MTLRSAKRILILDPSSDIWRVEMIATPKTDADLIKRLQESASKPIKKEELDRQRASYVFGNLPSDSTITRESVEKRIKMNEGA